MQEGRRKGYGEKIKRPLILSLFILVVILYLSKRLDHLTTVTHFDIKSNRTSKNRNQEQKKTKAKTDGVFIPGSLNLTRFEAYQRCYVDPTLYKHYFETKHYSFVSKENGLIYAQILKAGSTEIRLRMPIFSDINLMSCDNMNHSHYAAFQTFTFTREPMSRFISGFQETMHRWSLFHHAKSGGYIPPTEELKEFYNSYKNISLTTDHDNVLDALESLVTNHYNGYTLPNNHLELQITSILRPDCPRLDVIYNLEDVNSVFDKFLTERGMNASSPNFNKKRYQAKLHLNISRVSRKVKRKICQLSALDYCCLNYRLPPDCEGAVSCRWKERKYSEYLRLARQLNHSSSSSSSNDTVLLIEAVSPYPIIPQNL